MESNAIDFAARLNRSLLASMVGVRVDEESWDLSEPLPNGAMIEILTSEDGEVSNIYDLLENDLLPMTRRTVEDLLRHRDHDLMVDKGERLMEKVIKERGVFCLGDILGISSGWDSKVSRVLFEFGCEDLRDLHYKFGCGALSASKLVRFLDEVGLDGPKLKLVSVSLSGVNRQGVLASVSEKINSMGGDIVNLKLIWGDEGRYRLRLVIKGLLNKKDELESLFDDDGWSEEVEVV